MSKLILYPILAIIAVSIISVIAYFNGLVAFIIICAIGALFLYRFVQGIINLYKDRGKKLIMYVIKKGNHYSDIILPIFMFIKKECSITKTFNFSNSCLYHHGDADDYDINKLWGITFGINPLINSIRFGWNCENNDGNIELFVFRHTHGIMSYDKICTIKPETEYKYTIKILNGKARLFIDGGEEGCFTKEYDVNFSHFIVINKPYFGGNKCAPRDMIICEN